MRVPRRTFLAGLGAATALAPFAARAQGRLPVLGFFGDPEAFDGDPLQALADLGWVDGRDFTLVTRYGGDRS